MAPTAAFRRVSPLLLAAALLASPSAAQSPSPPSSAEVSREPAQYGINDHFVTIIDAYEFHTLVPTTTRADMSGSMYLFTGPPGGATMGASVNGKIPNGAVITSMCLVGFDNDADAGADLEVTLYRYLVDTIGGENPAVNVAASVSSSGTPQEFLSCVNNLNIPVLPRYDFSGDGDTEYVDFRLVADFGDLQDVYGSHMRLRFVRLTWKRRVSPGPAAATFADVPTNHPFFQFVEALSASGITAGCGGGNYCVNNPISRGEMAVFLAVALGLHWPAF